MSSSFETLLQAGALTLAAPLLAAALAAGCGRAPAPATAHPKAAPTAAPASAKPEVDICAGSPPVPHPFAGVLRNARCDQDMFITMASVAGQLGVECTHCHVVKATDRTKEDYPVMTPKKEIANWMSTHLMQALRSADGSPVRCKSCHTDEKGKPVAKILGSPRDIRKANEWMSLVMVNKFRAADGSRLKCKSCHGGNFGTKDFDAKVILQTARLPKHATGTKGTPSF